MSKTNKLNPEAIIKAFYSQRIAAPRLAPLHHYDVLLEAGLIDLPYTDEEMLTMSCESIMRLLTIEIDNLAFSIRAFVEKPTLNKFETLKYERLMRDKEFAMSTRAAVAVVAVGKPCEDEGVKRLITDMAKRYAIYWSKPIALISNLGDD